MSRILTWGDTAQLAALVAPRSLAVLGTGLPASVNNERPSYFSPLPRFDPGPGQAPAEDLAANYAWARRF